MIDPRIYRAAFLPALLALVALMFSLQQRPAPLEAELAPDAFDSVRASSSAREFAAAASDRATGSEGDAHAAAFVAERFGAIASGEVSLQRFEASSRGHTVQLRNVVLVLPGDSDRRVVVMARRDSARPPGALSSAAPTAALLELAGDFGDARHRKTLVFVSADGGPAGAAGARRFAERFPGRDRVEAVIVLGQPGVRDGRPPFVVPWSAGSHSTSIQLLQSAKSAVRQEVGRDPGVESWLGQFMRLAMPTAFQEQGVLLDAGLDAVTISSDGELPVRASRDRFSQLSATRFGQFGRAALALVSAIDGNREHLVHGPRTYLVFAGSLVPGWALALLGLAFLVPVAIAAVDAFARARRQDAGVGRWLRWLLAGALPFALVLGAVHLLALTDLIPSPDYPYDPRSYPLDGAAAAALASLVLVLTLGWLVGRQLVLPHPIERPEGDGPPAALALCLAAAALAVWALNPFAALLVVPAAHLWLFAGIPEFHRGRAAAASIIVAGLVGPLLAFSYLADKTGTGWGAVWQLVLMVADGQIGTPLALAGCLLAGCLVAVLAIARTARARAEPLPDITVRGPVTYAGPGSLGGTESALPRR